MENRAIIRFGLAENEPDPELASWLGPRPILGESWAAFQLRWGMYSMRWLLQICTVLSGLWIATQIFPTLSSRTWFNVASFALTLGAGMAALATMGFLAKAGKAKCLGPNPVHGQRMSRRM